MTAFLPKSIQQLIEEFSRLPGVGPKSAQRLAMHLLRTPQVRVQSLAHAIGDLQKGLQFCGTCWNIAEGDTCRICADPMRKQHQICVVEDILDVMALEKTSEYLGTYHVLHGVLSPVDGVGPEQLKIEALVQRIQEQAQNLRPQTTGQSGSTAPGIEVILATNPSLEGETTAMYLLRILKPMGVRITRIARGLPAGGDLDYADELTLSRALNGRAEYV
ncbi:MAG: recombination mediator RecR [Candidatus Gracilibacteria bacterium]